MSLIQNLKWRYATKNMTGASVSDEQLQTILEAINLAPTSYGLQLFSVIAVSNADVKAKLMGAAYGQKQIGSASHILVFAIPTTLTEATVETFIQRVATVRGIPAQVLDGYKAMMVGTITGLDTAGQQNWTARQAYIALGFALVAAAELHVDACPMEGFNTAEFDTILGLTEKGLKSVVVMPIGFRAEDDATAAYLKVRKAQADLVELVE